MKGGGLEGKVFKGTLGSEIIIGISFPCDWSKFWNVFNSRFGVGVFFFFGLMRKIQNDKQTEAPITIPTIAPGLSVEEDSDEVKSAPPVERDPRVVNWNLVVLDVVAARVVLDVVAARVVAARVVAARVVDGDGPQLLVGEKGGEEVVNAEVK